MVEAPTALVPGGERARVKRALLARHPVLAGCSPLTVRRFAGVADEVRVAAGEVIVEQGRHGLWFFLVEEGRAEVVRDGRLTGVLGPGQHFGEAAVLRQVTQPATVRAQTDMTLFVVGCQRLVPLVRDSRALRRRLGQPRALPLPRSRRLRRAVWAGLVSSALAAAALWHPPVAVVAPGPALDVARDITITGVATTPVHGRYLAPTIRATHPTLLGLGLALLHPHRRVVGMSDVTPPGTSQTALRASGAAAFHRSQLLGAIAGARAAGLPVGVPSSGNGVPVLPFTITFGPRAVTGPSAGLAYALAVEDLLDPVDRAGGRTIGATGDIGPDGRVGPVGYLAQKAAGAASAGASVLLVPDVEATDAWGQGVDARGVASLSAALGALG